MSDYEALKAVGHSPAKAAEIVLDAQRGDRYARAWIKNAHAVAGASFEADFEAAERRAYAEAGKGATDCPIT